MINGRFRTLCIVGLAAVAIAYCWILAVGAMINDDYMAMYTMWLMNSGKIPNVDFNVDSYTLLFDLLSPFFSVFGERFDIIYAFRAVMLLGLAGAAAQIRHIARPFVGRSALWMTLLLLFLGAPMYMRGLDVRPDLFILLIWLQVLILLSGDGALVSNRTWAIGVLAALGLLFKFKSVLIGLPIGIYFAYALYSRVSVRSLLFGMAKMAGGFTLALLAYGLVFGWYELAQLLGSSLGLMQKSASGSLEMPGLTVRTLFSSLRMDICYWALACGGMLLAAVKIREFSVRERLTLISLFVLAAVSILANPHYRAYNLVTLYPLVALFAALAVQYLMRLLSRSNKVRPAVAVVVAAVILLLPAGRLAQFATHRFLDSQRELQAFFMANTVPDQAIFAYEGVGLFRPSTYHWRTSLILLGNYHAGLYNVWQEIEKARPVFILRSYRVPGWLTREDQAAMASHYVPITPYLLTLGFQTDAAIKGNLLLGGSYEIHTASGQGCVLDGREAADGSVHQLKAGEHVLVSRGGLCTLHWHVKEDSLKRLVASNPESYSYLIAPN